MIVYQILKRLMKRYDNLREKAEIQTLLHFIGFELCFILNLAYIDDGILFILQLAMFCVWCSITYARFKNLAELEKLLKKGEK